MLIVGFVTYSFMSNDKTKQLHEREIKNLKQYQQAADQIMSEIPYTALELYNNHLDYLSEFNDINSIDFTNSKRMFNYNRSITNYNKNIESFYILNNNVNRLIVNDHFDDWSRFPDKEWLNMYQKSALSSSQTSLWQIRSLPAANSLTSEAGDILYTFVQPFQYLNPKRTGYVAVNINLNKLFSNIFPKDFPLYYVIDNSNHIIYGDPTYTDSVNKITSDKNSIEINGKSLLVFSINSPINNWRYICLYNETQLLYPLIHIRIVMFSLLIMVALFGILESFFISRKLYSPVNDFFQYMTHHFRTHNSTHEKNVILDFDTLKHHVNNFSQQQLQLQEKLSNELTIINENSIRKLLRSDIKPDAELLDSLFGKDSQGYVVVSLEDYSKIPFTNESNTLFTLTKKFLEPLEYKSVTTDIDDHLVSIIFYSNEKGFFDNHQEELRELCNHLLCFLNENGLNYCYSSISNTSTSVSMLNDSFLQSLTALKHRIYSDCDNIAQYNAIPQYRLDSVSTILSEYEIRLISALKEKSIERLESILNSMTENIKESYLQPEIIYSWFSLLRDILFGVPSSMGYSLNEIFFRDHTVLYEKFRYNKNIDDYKNYFIEICKNIILGLNNNSSQKNTELTEDIKTYIFDHISEDISLSAIADIYGLSAPYLSSMFKQETGQNFIKYVITTKMQTAMVLLTESNLKIKDISEKVGYYNDRSFYNAFKKFTGLSPNEYRIQYKKLH